MEIFAEMESRDEDLLAAHPQLLEYSKKSSFGDIVALLRKYPTLQTEKIEELLLLRALCFSTIGNTKEARTCVQNSLIIKFVRNLNVPNAVDLFFSKYLCLKIVL